MARTGVVPGPQAVELYKLARGTRMSTGIGSVPGLDSTTRVTPASVRWMMVSTARSTRSVLKNHPRQK